MTEQRVSALLAALLTLSFPVIGADLGAQSQAVNRLLPALTQYIKEGMAKTHVPGVAVAVVYRDKVVYLQGFGVRQAGKPELVDADTVFQLASVSKPITSTIVAGLVGDGTVSWDDRIADLDPEFQLSEPTIAAQVTVRDMLCHRTGLPTFAGDYLEDLGFTRPFILERMRQIPIKGTFRKTYEYSNFPYSEGALATAKQAGKVWEDLAEKRIFLPLGMASTSYRYSDYCNRANKAAIHVFVDDQPVARYEREPDAEAPAGGASSNVRDMAA